MKPITSKSTLSGIVAVCLLAILPLLNLGMYWTFIVFLFFTYLTMTNMWNLLAGYAGLVCLGYSSFIGIAGYTLGTLTLAGISPYLGVLLGGVTAVALCAVMAPPSP